MVAVLKITDGTNEIDLLSLPGFLLEAWRPTIPQYKGGGTFQSSPLSTGRQLVNKQFDNYIESFAFKAQDASQDDLIFEMQELRRLLEKASAYWTTDWQDEPVWIEARALCETNTRYAHIMTGYIPDDENPYAQPFGMPGTTESVMDDMALIIEHTGWADTEPGVSTAVEISGTQDFNSLTYGRSETSEKEVYVANHQNVANISNIYSYDASAVSFSANRITGALPYNLLPATPAVGDITYFGISTAITNYGPFTSLVFDLSDAQTDITGITWEYWNGAWVVLTVQDNTNADGAMTGVSFDTDGVKSVHWESPSDWSTTAINGVTCYWVRARVTAIGAAPTPPTQQSRNVYAIVRASVSIDDSQVGGDIPPLSNIEIYEVSDRDGSGGNAPDLYQTRAILSVRSLSRGQNFTPYLFCTSQQNPTGITVTYPSAVFSNASSPRLSASGRVAIALGAHGVGDSVALTFTSSFMAEYYGKYRVFVRSEFDVAASETSTFTMRLKSVIGSGSDPIYSDTYSVTLTGTPTFTIRPIVDCGTIEIGAGLIATEEGDSTVLTVQTSAGTANSSIVISDLVLMPVDEWSADVASSSTDTDSFLQRSTYLDIDSIKNPKRNIRSLLFNTSDQARCIYRTVTNGRSVLQSNAEQKIWFLFMRQETDYWSSDFESSYIVQINKQQRYFSMRGAR